MRKAFAFVALLLAALPAPAHFLWLVPKDGQAAILVFSDSLEPDEGVPITKVQQTELTVRAADGTAPKWQKAQGDGQYKITVDAKGPVEVTGTCRYGVITKKGDPYLLTYYAKTTLGGPVPGKATTPLAFVPVEGKGGTFHVHWQGQPLAKAEVVAHLPGEEKAQPIKVNPDGTFTLPAASSGPVGVRVKHVEAKEGELDGQRYKEVRHYATWTVSSR